MPKSPTSNRLPGGMTSRAIAGAHYGFSATRIDNLGAAEYTLVTIAADTSSSMSGFEGEVENCLGEVVRACQRSPRRDNLMLRTTVFHSQLEELHGFKPLSEVAPNDYTGALTPRGCTCLYEGAYNAVEALSLYGADLSDNDYDVNGIVFVITDGADNMGGKKAADVKRALMKATRSEDLESLISVLVGVNIKDPTIAGYLKTFHKEAGFKQYVEIGDADASSLARLADFVSRSISAQSRSLGSGGASPSLSF